MSYLKRGGAPRVLRSLTAFKSKIFQGVTIRLTRSEDIPAIKLLKKSHTKKIYGEQEFEEILETCVLSLSFVDDSDGVLGQVSFSDRPGRNSHAPKAWPGWLQEFGLECACPFNTLFVRHVVNHHKLSLSFMKEAVKKLYEIAPAVEYLILPLPKGVTKHIEMGGIFRSYAHPKDTSDTPLTICVCHRDYVFPKLKIRMARVEDADDLQPICTKLAPEMQEQYGDYYLAEMIAHSSKTVKILVMEAAGKAVGVMALNSTVNTSILNDHYQLASVGWLTTSKMTQEQVDEVESDRGSVETDVLNAFGLLGMAGRGPGGQAKGQDEVTTLMGPLGTSTSSVMSDTFSRTNELAEDTEIDYLGPTAEFLNTVCSSRQIMERRLSDLRAGDSLLSANIQAETEDERDLQTDAKPDEMPPKSPFDIETNAFAIQLFAIDEAYEHRADSFFNMAFDCYPDLEYMIITVPSIVPEFPMLRYFQRAIQRERSRFRHELYMLFRDTINRTMMVRPAIHSDVLQVQPILESFTNAKEIMMELMGAIERAKSDELAKRAYVAVMDYKLVGLAIVGPEMDLVYMRAHYNIDSFINFAVHKNDEHCRLYHMVLENKYHMHARFFYREVMRQDERNCLYYRIHPPYANPKQREVGLMTTLEEMVLVAPRKAVEYPDHTLGKNVPGSDIRFEGNPFALFHLNRQMSLAPKANVNARIVVVGASDFGLAVLKAFCLSVNMKFNNLILISPHGIPGTLPPDPIRNIFRPQTGNFSSSFMPFMALRTWVNVIYGEMTALDRYVQTVTVNNDLVVPYNYLFLCMGRQFQIPDGMKSALRENNSQKPENVFLINTEIDAAVIVQFFARSRLDIHGCVVVHGQCLEAYTALTGILKLDIVPHDIVLVHPERREYEDVRHMPKSMLEETIMDELKDMGVRVFSGYQFVKCNMDVTTGHVQRVDFAGRGGNLSFACRALFCFAHRGLSDTGFNAIVQCPLVYDGGLVVNASGRTADPYILAGGTFTTYARAYYASHCTHSYYNSKEVGMKIAERFMETIDPTRDYLRLARGKSKPGLVPIYTKPLVRAAVLPVGWNYLYVSKPGFAVTQRDASGRGQDPGRYMTTGDPSQPQGYFRFHLNSYKTIDNIVCFTKNSFPVNNMTALYGLHQTFLNNLEGRFDECLIPDFFAYLDQIWSIALYHDRFHILRQSVREVLSAPYIFNPVSFEEMARTMMRTRNITKLSAYEEVMLKHKFMVQRLPQRVEQKVLEYISEYIYQLPMYATPADIELLCKERHASPVHDLFRLTQLFELDEHGRAPRLPSLDFQDVYALVAVLPHQAEEGSAVGSEDTSDTFTDLLKSAF